MDGLIAEHISKTYAGTHGLSFAALRDVSIRLEPGSFTSLVGESVRAGVGFADVLGN